MWSRLMAALDGAFKSKSGQWFAALLAAVGIGLATHTVVVGPALGELVDYLQSLTGSVSGVYGAAAIRWMAFFNIDIAITMVASAYSARAGIRAARVALTKKA